MKIADIKMRFERQGKRFTLFKSGKYSDAMTNIYIDLSKCEGLPAGNIENLRIEVHVDETEARVIKPRFEEKPESWDKHFRTA